MFACKHVHRRSRRPFDALYIPGAFISQSCISQLIKHTSTLSKSPIETFNEVNRLGHIADKSCSPNAHTERYNGHVRGEWSAASPAMRLSAWTLCNASVCLRGRSFIRTMKVLPVSWEGLLRLISVAGPIESAWQDQRASRCIYTRRRDFCLQATRLGSAAHRKMSCTPWECVCSATCGLVPAAP